MTKSVFIGKTKPITSFVSNFLEKWKPWTFGTRNSGEG